MTAAERHVIENTELNQTRNFKDLFTLKWNSKNALHWGKCYAFLSTGNKRLWSSVRLVGMRFDQSGEI